MTSTPPWSVNETLRAASAHAHAGNATEALALFERALETNPNNADALFNLGTLALQLDQPERAAKHLRKAIERNRNVAEYHLHLSVALSSVGQYEEAAVAARIALKLKPRSAEAHCKLGYILGEQGKFGDATRHIQRAIAINPKLAAAHQALGTIHHLQCRVNDAMTSFRTAVMCDPEAAEPYLAIAKCLNYLPSANPALIADATHRWARLLKRSPEHPAHANEPAPNRKLRIGYVSGDFRRHPVAWFMESVLRTHNRGAVEIFCYSNNRKDDATTERLKPLADVWRPVGALDDREMAALVRADAIDILVDLSGHTVGGRLMVFRAKPAPIQCTWLGYYATTGLPEIDYIIADRFIIPAGDERHYSEAPWRLPDSYLCFTPPDLPVAVGQLPAQRNGFVTFGSCSNIMKVNLGVVAVWSRLLHAVANSRLILRSHALTNAGTGDELMRHFLAHDIAADRITLLPAAERAELLATYNEIDIALDPFPYGGGTTTVESLWMGVPVVTMRGDRFTGRVSESILSTAGLPELVVADEAAYLGKAIALSQNPTYLAELRAGLRDRLERSPMCDASRFTGHLEEAYRGMWRNWCAARETAA